MFRYKTELDNLFQPVKKHSVPRTIADILNTCELFVFDLDGTLYDQHKLRNILLAQLMIRWVTFRISLRELRIISCFRRRREERLGYASPQIDQEQYHWCADALSVPANEVLAVTERWMHEYPLKHLKKARYPKVKSFFGMLRQHDKKIAVFSDFPVERKLQALGLFANASYCSTAGNIAQLKPSKKAMELICSEFGIPPEKTVFFGDRDDTDGETARLAGVHFVKVDVKRARRGEFYRQLLNLITPAHENS